MQHRRLVVLARAGLALCLVGLFIAADQRDRFEWRLYEEFRKSDRLVLPPPWTSFQDTVQAVNLPALIPAEIAAYALGLAGVDAPFVKLVLNGLFIAAFWFTLPNFLWRRFLAAQPTRARQITGIVLLVTIIILMLAGLFAVASVCPCCGWEKRGLFFWALAGIVILGIACRHLRRSNTSLQLSGAPPATRQVK